SSEGSSTFDGFSIESIAQESNGSGNGRAATSTPIPISPAAAAIIAKPLAPKVAGASPPENRTVPNTEDAGEQTKRRMTSVQKKEPPKEDTNLNPLNPFGDESSEDESEVSFTEADVKRLEENIERRLEDAALFVARLEEEAKGGSRDAAKNLKELATSAVPNDTLSNNPFSDTTDGSPVRPAMPTPTGIDGKVKTLGKSKWINPFGDRDARDETAALPPGNPFESPAPKREKVSAVPPRGMGPGANSNPFESPAVSQQKVPEREQTNPFAGAASSNNPFEVASPSLTRSPHRKNLSSEWTSGAISMDALPQQEVSSTSSGALPSGSSVGSASTASTARPKTSMGAPTNPFAELLSLRQARKLEAKRRLGRSVGSVDLESSSQGTSSLSTRSDHRPKKRVVFCDESESNSESIDGQLFRDLKGILSKVRTTREVDMVNETKKAKKENIAAGEHASESTREFPRVLEDGRDDSSDGALFSDLKGTLSKIISVSHEESQDEQEERVFLANSREYAGTPKHGVIANKAENEDRPEGIRSHVVVKMGSESCGVSSLKDPSHFGAEEPFDDVDNDGDTVTSFQRSPAPLEMPRQEVVAQESFKGVHLLGQDGYSTHDDSSSQAKSNAARNANGAQHGRDKSGGDSVTVTCSNSNKVNCLDRKQDSDREDTTITPPKKSVVISSESNQSISTKDSIVGRTIDVSRADLAAERVYLESLRAQVLAELKVHVADEEIRLALDARLGAIRGYYRRKATSLQLRPAETPGPAPATAAALRSIRYKRDANFHEQLGHLPKVKATVITQSESMEGAEDGTAQSPSVPHTSNTIPYPQQRQNSHKFALERSQGKIDEAIKAVHDDAKKRRPKSMTFKPAQFAEEKTMDSEEEKVMDKEDELLNRQSTETPIPLHIFTKDTFWNDQDDPSQIVPSTPSASPGSGIEKSFPPTRAEIVGNAWNYYRTVNALIFDCRVYDSEFQTLQEDPLYPYLNSLMGIADSGEDGYNLEHKRISQKVRREYADKSPHRICHILSKEAEATLPALKVICANIGSKLGMQTLAVGPIKRPSEALLKCERKYGGDPLLVTDFCRASLFVKDVATLLALIEVVLSKYASTVRRIKLSTLKSDHAPLAGGYRDVKINLEVNGHVCEIQVHLIPLWLVKEAAGYGHYKECCERGVDGSDLDIGRTLSGLSRDTLSDLIRAGEASLMRRTPIVSLKQYHEDQIRDYCALSNIYLYYGTPAKAESILRRIIKLRSESSDFGPCHAETMSHMALLHRSLKSQHKHKSASLIKGQIAKARKMQQDRDRDTEPGLRELCLSGDHCGAVEFMCDMILDPSKKDRLEDKRRADGVEESRALWLRVRKSYIG
ncbi:hypothetical protein ACHAWF_011610, partial [Thalassiosira exigua]